MKTRLQSAVRRPLVLAAVVALVAGAGVYSARSLRANGQATPAAPPAAVAVFVHTLEPQKIRVWSEFSGRLHAVDAADVRPEVSGRITEVLFDDGQTVKAGDVLFVIDPRPYEAAVARARANLASTQTNVAFAKIEFERAATLIKTGAVSQRVYDERANSSRVANAALEGADAELKRALVDLDRAHVKAPISGRTSRAEVTLGNLVQAGPGAPLLTRIVANEAIYADFEVDEQTYVQTIRGVANRREDERRIPVQLVLQSDSSRVYDGYIYTFDNRIEVASGTIRARARFDNTTGTLLPGMFVAVRLAEAVEREALLVPDRAVGSDQSKKFVYVVGPDNKVAYRDVELGRQVLAQRIALKGVEPGDRVIVDGLQRVRPSMVVNATEAGPDRLAQASTPRSSTTR
ncbi:MAG TPA: efflux RND transporter periplasmic adaptor subunit [Alphaproteobacteria bacterium]